MAKKIERKLPETDIYGITAAAFSRGRDNVEVARQMLEAGVRIIQYREKDYYTARKYQECLAIRELTAKEGACFIVNDDVALAMAVKADGVHVGQDDLPVAKVRELVGDSMLVGLSTHAPEQVERAVREGIADYIGVGPLFATFTKKDVCAPVGLEYLDYVVKHHQKMPFVAIGGIKEANVAEVVRHGASCVCLVTDIVGAENIGEKVRAIRSAMARARLPL